MPTAVYPDGMARRMSFWRRWRYRLVVHTEPDHLWATVPGLPGVFVTGRSRAELEQAAAAAVAMVTP